MDETRDRSRFTRIARLILGVVIVLLVAFLLVRIISIRQTNNENAEKATDSAQQELNEEANGLSPEQTNAQNERQSGAEDIPTGIADGQPSTTAVPEVGMSTNIVIIATILMISTFLGASYVQKARAYKARN